VSKTTGGILALLGVIIAAGGTVYFHFISSSKYPFSSKHVLAALALGVIVLAIGIYGLVRPAAS
jgi:uncharacterized membrane protein